MENFIEIAVKENKPYLIWEGMGCSKEEFISVLTVDKTCMAKDVFEDYACGDMSCYLDNCPFYQGASTSDRLKEWLNCDQLPEICGFTGKEVDGFHVEYGHEKYNIYKLREIHELMAPSNVQSIEFTNGHVMGMDIIEQIIKYFEK